MATTLLQNLPSNLGYKSYPPPTFFTIFFHQGFPKFELIAAKDKGRVKKRPIFVVFDYEVVRTPPTMDQSWTLQKVKVDQKQNRMQVYAKKLYFT